VAVSASESPRAGRVEFSDGKVLEGRISLTPGSELKLHIGDQLRTVALDRVQEIQMTSEKESLEQGYRFPEAGRAIRQAVGKPYPVRYLTTKIILTGGETVTGHLYSTVLYVEGEEHAEKVILRAKQSGKEGDTIASLVYPARIRFGEPAKETEATVQLRLAAPFAGPETKVAALARGSLTRLEVKPTDQPGQYAMASPLGKEIFLAARTGSQIVVGWPRETDEKLAQRVRQALPDAEDFFDDRKVLGVFREGEAPEAYSLMLVARKGQTTLDQERSQPWRLEVYRWKLDEDDRRLMLAGRDYLFRGIEAKDQTLPKVALSDKLWRVRRQAEGWVAGED
jgi:hypothetical protein